MLVYIEYVTRQPGVSLEGFHAMAGAGQTGWADEHQDDQLLLSLARTWRLGPSPEHLVIWYSPNHGLERITEWERVFASGEARSFEDSFRVVAKINEAGCYRPLHPPKQPTTNRYYIEYFDPAPDATPTDITNYFNERAHHNNELELPLLVDRIGKLGPDPRGIAIWGLSSYEHLEAIACQLDHANHPIQLRHSGLYANLGQEVI